VIPIGPQIDILRNELRAVINPDRPRSSMILHDPPQDLDHLAAADPLADISIPDTGHR
jgi:hypothetical protein